MTTDRERIAELEKRNEALSKRLAELEGRTPAAPRSSGRMGGSMSPRDAALIDRMGVPNEVIEAMVAAVGTDVVRAIVDDNCKASRSAPVEKPVQRGSGWAEQRPLTNPPGVDICDKLMDQADAEDRAALVRRRGGV
jgi:hypothetical protein